VDEFLKEFKELLRKYNVDIYITYRSVFSGAQIMAVDTYVDGRYEVKDFGSHISELSIE
jgi:hypothetical protein